MSERKDIADVRKAWSENFKEVGIGSPQEAMANSVDYMTNPLDDRIMVLSDISGDEQRQIETLLLAGRVLNWRWMELAGKNRLALCCSRKGKRATLIAKMLHSVNLLGDGVGGVGKAIKNFVSGEGL